MKIIDAYKPLYESKKPIFSLMGSAASGKSYACAQRVILWAIEPKQKERILVVRKVHATLKESCFQDILSVLENNGFIENVHYIKRTSPLLIRFPNGSEVIFKGLDNPEKIKSISGISKVWVEEATELDVSDFNQLRLRLRTITATGLQTIISFNPISRANWIYRDFYEQPSAETQNQTTYIHTTYKDNPFNADEFVAELERLKTVDENYYKIYALGEWGGVTTQIYPNIQVKYDGFSNPDDTFYGVDFAYNNPSAVVKCELYDNQILVREVCYARGLTTGDLIDKLIEAGVDRDDVYCDSAEPDRIEELKRAGIHAKGAVKGGKQNSVSAGIGLIKYNSDKIYVHSSASNVMAELAKYSWQLDAKTNTVLDVPVKVHDHAMDAMRYAINSYVRKYKLWDTT